MEPSERAALIARVAERVGWTPYGVNGTWMRDGMLMANRDEITPYGERAIKDWLRDAGYGYTCKWYPKEQTCEFSLWLPFPRELKVYPRIAPTEADALLLAVDQLAKEGV